MKFIKAFLVFAAVFSLTVCSAAENKVFCNIVSDDKNEVASIAVLTDESGKEMSESDIIVYVKDAVEQCRKDGFENIILTVTDVLAYEENIAELIEGIDVICVTECEKFKPGHMIGDTMVVYTTDGTPVIDVVTDKTAETESENKKSPNETLNSMVLMCFVLIAIALIVLLAVKKKLKK